MPDKQKHYRIRITDKIHHRAMWYFNKQDTEHEAILGVNAMGKAVFIVGEWHCVYPVDCIILKEWISE